MNNTRVIYLRFAVVDLLICTIIYLSKKAQPILSLLLVDYLHLIAVGSACLQPSTNLEDWIGHNGNYLTASVFFNLHIVKTFHSH